MGILIIILAIAVLVVVALATKSQGRNGKARARRHTLPDSLKGAKLILCEPKHSIRTLKPFPIHGRPDEVYALGKTLVPVDTKTRNVTTVRDADIVKLSAYGAILRHGRQFRGYQVAGYGYIRLINRKTGRVAFRRIKLMSDAELVALNERRLALREGKAVPRATTNRRMCGGCGQRAKCPGFA